MTQALYTATTGMQAQQLNIDVIANNLANANTHGFKQQRTNFADLFYHQKRPVGASALGNHKVPAGIQVGIGVKPVGTARNFSQGALERTGRVFDMAIEGDGFFRVQLADGRIGYTRNGAFVVNADQEIVDQSGNRVEPGITVPTGAQDVAVSQTGEVSIRLPGQSTRQNIGSIELTTFVNPVGLEAIGENLFTETDQSGPAINGTAGEDGKGIIREQTLETANVELVRQLVDMIKAQRSYEVNSRVIQTGDQMLSTLGQLIRN